jgi:curli biogenesis system outer membrane secretion channel CsgG
MFMAKVMLVVLAAVMAISVGGLMGCGSTSVSSTYAVDTTPVATYAPPPRAVQSHTIAVIPFKDKTANSPIKGDVGNIAVDQLTTLLVGTGRFDVIERDRLDAILTEQGLAGKGIVDGATAAQIGKVLGAEYIFTGAVTNWEVKETKSGTWILIAGSKAKEITIELAVDGRIINSTTGAIIAAQSGEIKRTEKVSSTAILSISPNGYIKLDQSTAGKQLRLALDDMLRKMIPQVDAKLQ